MQREILVTNLNRIDYREAWDLQERLLAEALEIKKSWHAAHPSPGEKYAAPTTNRLLLCRHPHVFTLGKSGHESNLLADEAALQRINATYIRTNRGGDITYHGPGQLVAYPLLDLEYFFTDLGRYMRLLEEAIIQTLADFSIQATRLPGATGVWLEPDGPRARKICAMGVRSSRWVTMHGLALNINTDLSYFSHIVPCGITDKAVTSMATELGRVVDEAAVEAAFLKHFSEAFGAQLQEVSPAAIQR